MDARSGVDGIEWLFGPKVEDGRTIFRLWAPRAQTAALVLPQGSKIDMQRNRDGWFAVHVEDAVHGTRYAFSLDGDAPIPDPASAFQPDGVDGLSQVIDHHEFRWTADWTGRPWSEAVIYELHVGTFTPEGTYRAAIGKLGMLTDIGVTAIELMPLNTFPGRYGWGYDGVGLYAPTGLYGQPDDLVAFIDAAHGMGLMVFLDVVFNHFGPQGNHMPKAMPLLSQRHSSEFGTPPNLDGEDAPMIRRFLIENALHWLVRYRFDGLRLDAAHELHDTSKPHFLADLADAVKRATEGRRVHLVLENSHNEASWLSRRGDNRPEAYTAQWSDDIHHALHVAVTGENTGFYTGYDRPVAQLARALAEGFAFQGEVPPDNDKPKGEPSAHLPPTAFVAYLQNHDQVGNRPGGFRIGHEIDPGTLEAMAAIILLSPAIPLIFMGEEWNASTPFHYFSDLEEGLRDEVRKSRRKFMAKWGKEEPAPDAFDPAAFSSSQLDWEERGQPRYKACLEIYRPLLDIRRKHLTPRLGGIAGHAGRYEMLGEKRFRVAWTLADGTIWRMDVDFAAHADAAEAEGKLLWHNAGQKSSPIVLVSILRQAKERGLPIRIGAS